MISPPVHLPSPHARKPHLSLLIVERVKQRLDAVKAQLDGPKELWRTLRCVGGKKLSWWEELIELEQSVGRWELRVNRARAAERGWGT
jgi:hypothetical protein